MTEKGVITKVRLSSSWTSFIKYFPIVGGAAVTIITIMTEQTESAIIPLTFLLLGLGTNLFVVDASVDKEFIYVKQWVKENKYSIDSLNKIGDFSKGMTIIDIKTNVSTTRTFLIINDFNSFYSDDSKDISSFLIKLKAAYSANKKQEQ